MLRWFKKFGQGRAGDARAMDASSVPEGTIVYAIGDIHGRLDLLQQLEAMIKEDAAGVDANRRVIVCLGDYIDRGENSRDVVEHLLQGPPADFERICLSGNHESYLLRVFDDPSVLAAWMANGGHETLVSYGVKPPAWYDVAEASQNLQTELRAHVPASHQEFLRSLALSHREGDYFFAHAGVRPGVPLDQQDPHDLMWIREEFLTDKGDYEAVIVHGHTIRPEPENFAHRIGVDTGAYGTGHLTCVVLWGNERRFLSTA